MADIETDPGYRDPDDALRELIERHHLILQMQEAPGWGLWKDYLAAHAGHYQNRLLYGKHSTIEDYRYDAGVLQGIRLALGADEKLGQAIAAVRNTLNESQPPEQDGLATDDED